MFLILDNPASILESSCATITAIFMFTTPAETHPNTIFEFAMRVLINRVRTVLTNATFSVPASALSVLSVYLGSEGKALQKHEMFDSRPQARKAHNEQRLPCSRSEIMTIPVNSTLTVPSTAQHWPSHRVFLSFKVSNPGTKGPQVRHLFFVPEAMH